MKYEIVECANCRYLVNNLPCNDCSVLLKGNFNSNKVVRIEWVLLLKLYSSCPFTLKKFLVVTVYSHLHQYWRVPIKSWTDMKYVNLSCSGILIFRIISVTSTFTVWETYTKKLESNSFSNTLQARIQNFRRRGGGGGWSQPFLTFCMAGQSGQQWGIY